MPAYQERIYFCPAGDGRPVRVVPFPAWWRRSAFFARFGPRAIDTGNPFYVDHALLLTSAEALAWDRECREALAAEPAGRAAPSAAALREWDALLDAAGWVIVESYEWESGLD